MALGKLVKLRTSCRFSPPGSVTCYSNISPCIYVERFAAGDNSAAAVVESGRFLEQHSYKIRI